VISALMAGSVFDVHVGRRCPRSITFERLAADELSLFQGSHKRCRLKSLGHSLHRCHHIIRCRFRLTYQPMCRSTCQAVSSHKALELFAFAVVKILCEPYWGCIKVPLAQSPLHLIYMPGIRKRRGGSIFHPQKLATCNQSRLKHSPAN
jgi:hypothetical protein